MGNENEIIIKSNGLVISDSEDTKPLPPAGDIHKNIFDEMYADIFGGEANDNQPSVAETKLTVAGSDAKLGETPTMDSGKYAADQYSGDLLSFITAKPDAAATETITVSSKKYNWKHILFIVAIVVIAFIILKAIFKNN